MREIQIATIFSAYSTGNILLDDTYTSWKTFSGFLANQQSEHTLGHRFCDKEHCVSWLGFNLMLNAGMTEYWKCAMNLE